MNKKSGSGSGPFLMEMLVVVGFFIICASICVLVFVKADNISKDARDINQAALEAQSLAEMMKAEVEPQWTEMMPEKDIWSLLPPGQEDITQENVLDEIKEAPDYDRLRAVYWDSSWQIMEPDSSPAYLGVVARGTVDGMEKADIRIYRYGAGGDRRKLLFHLNTETYQKTAEAEVIGKNRENRDQASIEAQRLADMIKAGKTPSWSEMFPSRDVWSVIDVGEQVDLAIANAPDHDGIWTVYWDSEWQAILPCTLPDYLGFIETGTVDGQVKADIRIYRYGEGTDKGKLLCHITTDTCEQP